MPKGQTKRKTTMGQAHRKQRSKSVIAAQPAPVEAKPEQPQDAATTIDTVDGSSCPDVSTYSDSFVRNNLLSSVIKRQSNVESPIKAASPVFDIDVSNVLLKYISSVVSTRDSLRKSVKQTTPADNKALLCSSADHEQTLTSGDVEISFSVDVDTEQKTQVAESDQECPTKCDELVLWVDPSAIISAAARKYSDVIIALPDRSSMAIECV
jgi:hypothetical protein